METVRLRYEPDIDGGWCALAEYRCRCCDSWVVADAIGGLDEPDAHMYTEDLLAAAREALGES